MSAKPKGKAIVSRLRFAEDDPVFSELSTFTSDATIRQHLYYLIRRGREAIMKDMLTSASTSFAMPVSQIPPANPGAASSIGNEPASITVSETPTNAVPDLTEAIGKIDTASLDWLDAGEWPQTP